MAGVIGTDRFSYDVWGETVNLASRLESHGLPGQIHVSGEVKRGLGKSFHFEPRGRIEIKGVGRLETWMLKHEKTRYPVWTAAFSVDPVCFGNFEIPAKAGIHL